MGIKQWFGESLVSLIQDSQINQSAQKQSHHNNGLESMFGGAAPAVVAFKISNGYVVRTIDTNSEIVGMRQGGFTYCKDHQEIAEHIIASEAKRKLGIRADEYQQEMFAAEKARAVAMAGTPSYIARSNRI